MFMSRDMLYIVVPYGIDDGVVKTLMQRAAENNGLTFDTVYGTLEKIGGCGCRCLLAQFGGIKNDEPYNKHIELIDKSGEDNRHEVERYTSHLRQLLNR